MFLVEQDAVDGSRSLFAVEQRPMGKALGICLRLPKLLVCLDWVNVSFLKLADGWPTSSARVKERLSRTVSLGHTPATRQRSVVRYCWAGRDDRRVVPGHVGDDEGDASGGMRRGDERYPVLRSKVVPSVGGSARLAISRVFPDTGPRSLAILGARLQPSPSCSRLPTYLRWVREWMFPDPTLVGCAWERRAARRTLIGVVRLLSQDWWPDVGQHAALLDPDHCKLDISTVSGDSYRKS